MKSGISLAFYFCIIQILRVAINQKVFIVKLIFSCVDWRHHSRQYFINLFDVDEVRQYVSFFKQSDK